MGIIGSTGRNCFKKSVEMKKEFMYLLAGVLLGFAYGSFRKKRGRVIVDRIDKISESEFSKGRLGQFPDLN
jgi:hypothetical protein